MAYNLIHVGGTKNGKTIQVDQMPIGPCVQYPIGNPAAQGNPHYEEYVFGEVVDLGGGDFDVTCQYAGRGIHANLSAA